MGVARTGREGCAPQPWLAHGGLGNACGCYRIEQLLTEPLSVFLWGLLWFCFFLNSPSISENSASY